MRLATKYRKCKKCDIKIPTCQVYCARCERLIKEAEKREEQLRKEGKLL